MRVAVLLLLVLAIGIAVGRLTAPGERGRGGERGARLPGTPHDLREEEPAAGAEHARPETFPPVSDVEEPDPTGVALPSEPSEDSGDDGVLLVDLGGLPRAWVGSVDIDGAYDTEESDSREGEPARFQDAPGTYDVWWLDKEGRRVGTRARLDAGKVTRLRAADYRNQPPIPRGLGVLNLFVEAADGGGLEAEVVVSDGRSNLGVWTSDDGYGSVVIRPGRCTLFIGAHRSEAVVEEGRTTIHRIAHDREGDLAFVAGRPMNVSLRGVGDPDFTWTCPIGAPGTTSVVPYLAEGDYDVFIPYSFGVPLERVTIHPGRTTRLRCEPPSGGVLVRVVPESAAVYIGPYLDGNAEASQRESVRWSRSGPVLLMPGRYVVTASAALCEPRSTRVDVADRVVEVTLELAPLR